MDLAKNFVCVKVDTGEDEEAAKALEAGGKGLPLIQIRDAAGNLHFERVGYMTENEMVEVLKTRRPPPQG